MFNVITLVFNFGAFTTRKNFTSETHCYDLSLIGLHPFRVLVYEIKSSLNLHLKPNGSCDRIRTLVTMCEEKRDILLQMDEEDRNFLKALFGSYIRKLVLSEELMQLLHRLSKVFPKDVKQHMFETCLPLKMLDAEKAGRKRSRDPTDPDSYEADCSICRSPYPLPQLGLDVPGDPICRVCSQIFRIKIQKILSGLPFTKIVES
jgi:tRNA threonylcarbamoyladenosine modification (KEOPS) complex  Pcc1 subunit